MTIGEERFADFFANTPSATLPLSTEPMLVLQNGVTKQVPVGGGSGSVPITIGGTPTIGGTDTCILFQKGSVVGEDTNLEWDYTNHRLKINTQASNPILLGPDDASPTYNLISLNGQTTDTAGVNLGFVGGASGDPVLYLEAPTSGSFSFSVAGTNIADILLHIIKLGSVNALLTIPSGSGDSWFVGGAGNTTLTGFQNFGMGSGALFSLTSGNNNIAIGTNALVFATGAVHNVAIGASALFNSTNTLQNVGIGGIALFNNNADGNIAIGYSTLAAATVSYYNIAIGPFAGMGITTGQFNVLIGGAPLGSNPVGNTITSGSQNIVIGSQCDVPSPTANGQLSVGNFIYGTGLTGTGSTISSGWIGIGKKAAFGSEALGVVGGITVSGDPGGVASSNTLSGSNSTTISTGTGTVKMSSANNANNTGWLKCYIGTQVAWIPCWTTNAP